MPRGGVRVAGPGKRIGRPPNKNNTATHRECGSCRQVLTHDHFYKQAGAPYGISHRCKPCVSDYEKASKHRRKHARPEVIRDYKLRRAYGITQAQFDDMLAAQGGKCACCGTTTPGGKGNQFHVDHCHDTGKVRGLLCSRCNVGLGHFGHDPERIRSAIAYIKAHANKLE